MQVFCEVKRKSLFKIVLKLKMTSVQCMYFLLNFWLMVLIINNYNIISTIIIIGKKVTTKLSKERQSWHM